MSLESELLVRVVAAAEADRRKRPLRLDRPMKRAGAGAPALRIAAPGRQALVALLHATL